jgi:hypothetical protein
VRGGGGRGGPFFRRPTLAEFKLIIDSFPSRPEHQVSKKKGKSVKKTLKLIKEDFL